MMHTVGCTFHGFRYQDYLGEKKVFDGPATISDLPAYDFGDVDGFKSYYCECELSYIDCVPEDKYALVLYCDASSAQVKEQS